MSKGEGNQTGSILHKDINILAEEIVSTRTAWLFSGICARGTKFPDDTICNDSGADVTAGGEAEDQKRYYNTALHYSPDAPLLYYAANIARRDFPEDSNPKTIVVSRTPSSVPGVDEVVISGKSTTLDNRESSAEYILIQRIRSDSAKDLFQTLRKNSNFFEVYYKTAFPGLDSGKRDYNGLWRLSANKLIVLEQEQLKELAKNNPAKLSWRNDGSFDDPNISEQDAKHFLSKSSSLSLRPPSGIGELADFAPIKMKTRVEWAQRRR